MEPITVLSLFDGISGGQLALQQAGIPVKQYFASEVDKYAISITQHNFPHTIQLGDVREVHGCMLPPIDLLLGGFPCPSFSNAGAKEGFDNPSGQLFFEYLRLLKAIRPTYFLAENVKMRADFRDRISQELGVEPVLINSALVSAQNRERNYWANWEFPHPEEKEIFLADILETEGEFKYLPLAEYWGERPGNSYCKHVGNADIKGTESIKRVYSPRGKCPTLTTMGGGHREPKVLIDEKTCRKLTPLECERAQSNPDGYTAFGWDASKQKTVKISNTQRYKALGNGWNMETVAHILSFLPKISD